MPSPSGAVAMTTTEVPASTPIYRNVRVLAWAYQLAVFAVVLAIAMWLLGNYRANAAASGIPTGFEFLTNPTTFSIPGSDLRPTQPIRDALVVGILNTIRISVVGLLFATVLGIIVGIGRLSRNWLVSKASEVYVELFRNLPLLVILTFVYLGLVLQGMPRIEQAWTPLGWFVVSNRGIGVPWIDGASPWGLVGFLALGLAGWWLIIRWQGARFERTGKPSRAGRYGGGFLVASLIVGWLVLGAEASLPGVVGRQIRGGMFVDPSYFAVVLALILYTASHIAEITRGSIQAVPKGQGEAASSLALSGFQRMWNVVLPQAMRIAIPPMGNQYLNLIKNSSLGAGFGYFDITGVTQVAVGNGSPAVPAFFLALVFYVFLSLITSVGVNFANRHFRVVER